MVWVVSVLFWYSHFHFLCVVFVCNLFCPQGSLPSPAVLRHESHLTPIFISRTTERLQDDVSVPELSLPPPPGNECLALSRNDLVLLRVRFLMILFAHRTHFQCFKINRFIFIVIVCLLDPHSHQPVTEHVSQFVL